MSFLGRFLRLIADNVKADEEASHIIAECLRYSDLVDQLTAIPLATSCEACQMDRGIRLERDLQLRAAEDILEQLQRLSATYCSCQVALDFARELRDRTQAELSTAHIHTHWRWRRQEGIHLMRFTEQEHLREEFYRPRLASWALDWLPFDEERETQQNVVDSVGDVEDVETEETVEAVENLESVENGNTTDVEAVVVEGHDNAQTGESD